MEEINGVPIQNCFQGETANLKFEGEVSIHMIEAMIEVGKTVGLTFSLFKALPSPIPPFQEIRATKGYLYVLRERIDEERGMDELPDVFWNHSRRIYSRNAEKVGGTLSLIAGPKPIYYG